MWGVRYGIVGTDGGWSLGNYVRPSSFVEVVPATAEEARAGNFQLCIRDLELVFHPDKRSLLIESDGIRLSTEVTWELRQVRDFLFHLHLERHWEDQFLAVDVGGREVSLVRPGQGFGGEGERGQVLSASVQPIRSGGRYAGSNVPVLLEPAEGAVLDNGSRGPDNAVWSFRWTPVDGADLYELAMDGFGRRQVRQPACVITWRGQRYGGDGRDRDRTWKVRARREGKWLPWSKTGTCAGIEKFDTDFDADIADYMTGGPGKVDRSAGKPPELMRPVGGALLDNGRADGLDSLSWKFEWSRVRSAKDYEIVIVRPGDDGPFLREKVRGTRFKFNSDTYRVFGPRRKGWFWRVRALGRRGLGGWSEKGYFHVKPLDVDPPRKSAGSAGSAASRDVPTLLTPKPGAGLEHSEPREGATGKPHHWTFRWKAVSGAEAYEFEYGGRGGSWEPAHRERVEKPRLEVESGKGVSMWREELLDWCWRVRAIRDGTPLPWSPMRPFDIVPRGRR